MDKCEPAYQHDCEACQFVGQTSPRPGEEPVNVVDLWRHDHKPEGRVTLIRRFSSDGSDYTSTTIRIA